MMKLKVQQVFDATQVLARFINENRPLPSKGKYRVARMHAKLFPEFTTANDQRTAKIATYDHKVPTVGGLVVEATEENLKNPGVVMQNAVPDGEMPGFIAWWNELAAVEIEVNIDPIPIDQLCIEGQEGSISYAEFAVLGELVD